MTMTKALICAVLLVFIVASTVGPACSGTLVLVDLSGSVRTAVAGEGKGSPLEKNMAMLKAEIRRLAKGETLTAIGFGRKTDVVLLRVAMPKRGGPMNMNLVATRDAAIKKLQENLKSRAAAIDGSRTDVIGACFRASRIIQEDRADMPAGKDGKAPVRLVVLSDMIDNENVDLSLNRLKAGAHRDFLKKADAIGYPNLKGVEVHIFSAFSDVGGLSTVETEVSLRELKAFWMGFFERSGCTVKSYKTSY